MRPSEDCSRTWAALGHAMEVVESNSQRGRRPGYVVDPVTPRKGYEYQDGVVHFGADSVGAGDFPEHPGDLGAQEGRAAVNECVHEGQRRLLAPRWHSREPHGPVISQAVPRAVEGVLHPVLRDLDRDVVQVARGIGVLGNEGGDVLRYSP